MAFSGFVEPVQPLGMVLSGGTETRIETASDAGPGSQPRRPGILAGQGGGG